MSAGQLAGQGETDIILTNYLAKSEMPSYKGGISQQGLEIREISFKDAKNQSLTNSLRFNSD